MSEVLYIRNAAEGGQTRLEVYGAYEIKDALKADGYRWDGERRAWTKLATPSDQRAELIKIFKAAAAAGQDLVAGSLVERVCEQAGVQPCAADAKLPRPFGYGEAYSLSELRDALGAKRSATPAPAPAAAEAPEVAAARAEFEQADAAAERDHYGMAEFALPLNDVIETRGGMEEAQMRFFVDGDGRYRWEAGGRQQFGGKAQALAAYIKALEV